MLKTFKYVFVLAFVLGGWVLAAASLHVVRAPATNKYIPVNLRVVTKDRLSFEHTWVDLTRWTAADAARNPEVVARLEGAGKGKLLEHVGVSNAEAVPASARQAPASPAHN